MAQKEGMDVASQVATEGEGSDSQLSLASQPSESDPAAVVLSSPPDGGCVAMEEPLQSEEIIDNDEDDNVFTESSMETGSEETEKTTEKEDIPPTIVAEKTIEKDNSPQAMSVESPELPLQSDPSASITESSSLRESSEQKTGGSVLERGSTDGQHMREGGEGVVGEGGEGAALEHACRPEDLKHDHSYFSVTLEGSSRDDPQSRGGGRSNAAVGLSDHAYCHMTSLGSSHHHSAPPYKSRDQSSLSSKLSSNIPDHNYCTPSDNDIHDYCHPAHSTLKAGEVCDTLQERESEQVAGSQELFTVTESLHDGCGLVDSDVGVTVPAVDGGSVAIVSPVHVGCQTVPHEPETAEKSTDTSSLEGEAVLPKDTLTLCSPDDSLKSVIDTSLMRDDLTPSTLWRIHQQLVRGLSLVSNRIEKLYSNSS